MKRSSASLGSLNIDSVATTAWRLLQDAVSEAGHAFRTPVFSTLSDTTPDSRTVVLRRADPDTRTLECYTDRRSAKIAQLRVNPGVCWVFYDPHAKLQLRARGQCQVHVNDAITAQRWALMSEHGRHEYTQIMQPGQRVSGSAGNAPRAEAVSSDSGQKNFAVLNSTIEELEWLLLSRDGHQRAIAELIDNHWSSHWVMP